MKTSSRLPSAGPSSPWSSRDIPRAMSRRAFTGSAAAAAGLVVAGGWTCPATSIPAPGPAGPFSASGAPRLPAGFKRNFKSHFVRAGGLRQHVVIGGTGPPVLLVHGWPENWYAWRLVMPALARDFTVVAVDQRGIGLTDKPRRGYDTATLANDLVNLMEALGHQRFALVGHDTGFLIGYALAADHPRRLTRVALAEVPGPAGAVPSPPLFVPDALNNRLWHIPFNRVNNELTVQLVQGREDVFFGYEFDIHDGGRRLPGYARRYYTSLFARSRSALRGSFEFYRAWGAMLEQNQQRAKRPLEMPVLAIGGASSWGAGVAKSMKPLASDVHTAVIPQAGHWVAEQAPRALVASLSEFLAPHRAVTRAGA